MPAGGIFFYFRCWWVGCGLVVSLTCVGVAPFICTCLQPLLKCVQLDFSNSAPASIGATHTGSETQRYEERGPTNTGSENSRT